MDVVRRRLGPMFQPKMRPPAALEFLKFNSDAAGRFQIPGDDPLTASQDWADDEELAVRHQLKARLQAAGNQASQLASAPGPAAALDAKPGQQVDQGTGVALGKHGAAPQNGLVIPGIPANALPDAHRVGCESNSGPVGGVHPNSSAIQADRPQSSNPQVSEQHWHPHPEHGLPPPQSLPHSAGHLPPSGNFNATPPWRTPLHGTPNHYLPHPTPQSAHAMPVGHMVYNTLPPQAAPYADYVGYGDSGEYMPPLPSEPYDGDGSPPPPLPDEPPPLPDEPYEVAFPDSQVCLLAILSCCMGGFFQSTLWLKSAHQANSPMCRKLPLLTVLQTLLVVLWRHSYKWQQWKRLCLLTVHLSTAWAMRQVQVMTVQRPNHTLTAPPQQEHGRWLCHRFNSLLRHHQRLRSKRRLRDFQITLPLRHCQSPRHHFQWVLILLHSHQ